MPPQSKRGQDAPRGETPAKTTGQARAAKSPPRPKKAPPATPPATPTPQDPETSRLSTDEMVPPIPESRSLPPGYIAPSSFEAERYATDQPHAPAAAPVDAVPPFPASAPVPTSEVQPPSFETILAVAPSPSLPPDGLVVAAPAGISQASAGDRLLSDAPDDRTATDALPLPDRDCRPDGVSHPAEVFLRGVLDNLTPETDLSLSVALDPKTCGLVAEQLFFFSHALQLLLCPLECPRPVRRRHEEEPRGRLTVQLRGFDRGRHSLRVYDSGSFFRSYLGDCRLDAEALRPLVLFVTKRHGSIRLKQGRCVEFEITG